MLKRFAALILGLTFVSCSALAQEGTIQRAKVAKLDLKEKSITLRVGEQERTLRIIESTQVLGAQGKTLEERFKNIKEGAAVLFKAGKKDGLAALVAIKLDDEPRTAGKPISGDTSKLVALPELGTGNYQGFEGGLYPGGKNERPRDHEAAGLRLAKEVVPRDGSGQPSPDGKIVLLSVGMSNTSQASQGFARHLAAFKARNPRLVFVNGAQGAMTAARIQDPDDNGGGAKYWTTVDDFLNKAGVTRAQVQVIWLKQADAGPREGFPAYAKKLQGEIARIMQVVAQRFPNAKLAYLSSRTYGGFATTPLNPEPYAYESGFAVKWLIEQQLGGDAALNYDAGRGKVTAPWLSWGPYLWANGAKKNADGLFYEVGDFVQDGTHHSQAGIEKQGRQLLEFFRSDSTTRGWFSRP